MSLLIHAHVDVTGSREEREAYRLRVADLLLDELLPVEERYSPERLGYDLKVEGGIPFPPFVAASQAVPGVTVSVEWMNAETNERGSATIVDGRLQAVSVSARGAGTDPGPELNFASVDTARGLRLAFTCVRLAPNEYRGYAISGDRDTVFHAIHDSATGRGELCLSAGTADWSERWTFDLANGQCEGGEIEPEAIDVAEYRALTVLAEAFAGDWIWFAERPEEEIAVERDRYRSLGIPERAGNLKSAKLYRMEQQELGAGRSWVWSSLDSDSQWVRYVLEACWAGQ